jgi:hypothetical protein
MASPNREGTIDSRLELKLYRSFARKKEAQAKVLGLLSFLNRFAAYGTLSPIVLLLESVPAAAVTVIV